MAAAPKKTAKPNLWRAEIEPRLRSLRLYEEFRRRGPADGFFSRMDSTLIDAIYYAHQRAKVIVETLPGYTLHDSDHLFRVAELMGKLISDEQLRKISIVDLYLLLLCAFFHDLGLAPTKREINSWRNALHHEFVPKHSDADSISNFISSRPEQRQLLAHLSKIDDEKGLTKLEGKLISQFIRETHGGRLADIIGEDWASRFQYRDTDLTPYVTLICQSHVEDALRLSALESLVPCGDEVVFSPPFVGVILRLADLLDFDAKRAPAALFDAMDVDDSISLLEWAKHRSVSAWTITPQHLQIKADCVHPVIQVAIYEYCDILDDELLKCSAVTSSLSDPVRAVPKCYTARFTSKVDRTRIAPKKLHNGAPLYTFSKTRFTLDQDKVVDLLMGTSLYGNPAVALRELLQNSIDACLVRAAFEKAWGRSYQPRISIEFDRTNERHALTVTDNGIGMDDDIVHNYYAKVGSCYYKSAKFFRLLAENRVLFTSISRFGIGVLSYFLVASRVMVSSRRLLAVNTLADAIDVKVDGVNGLILDFRRNVGRCWNGNYPGVNG